MKHQIKKHKWQLWLVAAVVFASIMALLGAWTLRPYELLVIKGESEISSGDRAYKPGERITFVRPEGACNFGTGPQSTFRWIEFENGKRIGIPDNPFDDPMPPEGCVENSTLETFVPLSAQRAGQWRFQFDTSYKPNPLRTITVTSYSAWFEVQP